MPLTLECSCPGDANVQACELVELVWIVDLSSDAQLAQVQIYAHPGSAGYGPTTGGGVSIHSEIILTAGALTPPSYWIAHWATMYVTLYAAQGRGDNLGTRATWYIRQHYECVDPITGLTNIVYRNSYPTTTDQQTCVDGVIQIIGAASGGGGAIFVKHASPLGCTDLLVSVGAFLPGTDPPTIKATSSSGSICLCATGGTAPYLYTILTGTLPSGQTLDPFTACITGTPDGVDPGSGSITFRVTDATGATADVACGGMQSCGGGSVEEIGNSFY